MNDLAVGAAVLGTGGGGDPYIGMLLAKQAIRDHGPVQVVDVDEVPDDALVVPAAMMGAPTVMVEKMPEGDEIIRALEALENYLGRPITHTVSAEAGGLNSTLPFMVAARMGIPLADADAMGRAFPEIQMCIPTIYGISATPMALADEKGNSVIIETIDNRWTERFARSITVDMGCTALIALYSLSGAQLKESMIPGTLGLCEELGRTIRETRAAHGDPIRAILDRLHGFELFEGKIADVERRTEAGFARGEARIEGVAADTGSALVLRFQNEHLVAIRDAEVIASVPDLIIVLASETGEPITTEELRYGFRVTVVAAPCDPRWRTPAGLELVGPRYFGYDVDYVPIEERQRPRASSSRLQCRTVDEEVRQPKDVVRALVDAYNAKSAEGVLDLYHADAFFWDPLHRGGLRGHAAIGDVLRALFAAYPDERMEVVTLAGDEVHVVAEFRSTGTAGGDPFEIQFTEVYEVTDGRIASCRVYLDPEELPA
jgi:hypothetical protein